eukprot:741086-Lingulodinium_polyedra.AAC.1
MSGRSPRRRPLTTPPTTRSSCWRAEWRGRPGGATKRPGVLRTAAFVAPARTSRSCGDQGMPPSPGRP